MTFTVTDRPAPERFRITYNDPTRPAEVVLAHAVNMPSIVGDRGSLVTIYRDIDGRWTLLVAVDAHRVAEIRNLDKPTGAPGRADRIRHRAGRAWRWITT